MAMVLDQKVEFKHFCKVCKRGFGCGRALGGHMRAHGIGDEQGNMDDEDPGNDWEEKLGGNTPPGNKRMYALRTNPNRLKSCRICENCGKEFSSWKSFLEHGKCNSGDGDGDGNREGKESPVYSPESDDEDEEGRRDCVWSKGKRSRRAKLSNLNSNCPNCPSNEEEDLANCLVMLSNARVDHPLVVETEESCASASKEEEWRNPVGFVVDPANNRISAEKAKGIATRGLFQCKACKKVFNSHQALGGHRASHKKVKGCFAAKLDDFRDEGLVIEEDVITHDEFSINPSKSTSIIPFQNIPQPPLATLLPSKRKSKVHECSICHRIFSSGQALGGHKRCHWITSNTPGVTSSIANFHQFQDHIQQFHKGPKLNNPEPLDLNLPAPGDGIAGIQQESENPLSLEVSTAIYLQSWIGMQNNGNNDTHYNHHHQNNNNNTTISTTNVNSSIHNVDDEADSKIKLVKLSDLKDNLGGGGSSPWLQVGIGSSTGNNSSDP